MTRAERIEAAARALITWVDGPQPRKEGERLTDALRAALASPADAPRDDPRDLALRNILMLTKRQWDKGIDGKWAEHIVRFCREGRVESEPLRAPPPSATLEPKENP